MIYNYLKVTWRNMSKSKVFTSINLLGMSLSLACCIILFLFAQTELSYDEHHGSDIFRLTSTLTQKDGNVFKTATSSVPIANSIKEEIAGIEDAARITGSSLFGGKNTIAREANSWYVEEGYIADSNIFNVLKYDIILGEREQPLLHNGAVVLEKKWAKTIFGEEDPIGKLIKISSKFGTDDFEVTAIYDKDRFDCHLEPSYFISMSNNQWNNFFNRDRTNWVGNNLVFTYLKLQSGADPDAVDEQIHQVFLKYGSEQMEAMGLSKEMDLQPITSTHTDTDFLINTPGTNSLTYIYVLAFIGIIILLLACVNYINLSTAKAGKRALEVGIRKVMGVSHRGLMKQFLSESILLVFISLLISLLLAKLALPFFNNLIDNPVHLDTESISIVLMYMLIFLVFTGLIAGLYPALYMASFKPQVVLKGRNRDRAGSALLRKVLVILQFAITICLISSILIISQQVEYIKAKELGFSANQKVIIPLSSEESEIEYQTLKNAFSAHSAVFDLSGSDNIPGTPVINDYLIYRDGQTMDDAIHIYNNRVDLGFTEILGLEILSGHDFKDYNRDSTREQILISEKAVRLLDLEVDEAPGQMVYFDWEGRRIEFEILGVVNDIHQFSLHQEIDPMMYVIGNGEQYGYITIKADMSNYQQLIGDLEKDWKSIIEESPFEFYTLNEHMLLQYSRDFNTYSLIKYFAYMSIVISCLGLYAMSLFTAENRFKDIGIRKTFGAGTDKILAMVTMDLSKLILIAFLFSIPITWYGMKEWLDGFAYKISPGIEMYLLGGCISIAIGWMTISYQSIKAALTNPVDVLRNE